MNFEDFKNIISEQNSKITDISNQEYLILLSLFNVKLIISAKKSLMGALKDFLPSIWHFYLVF